MSGQPMQTETAKRPPWETRVTCGQRGGRRKNGDPCGAPVIAGTDRCRMHSGKPARRAVAEGAVRLELQRWGIDGHTTLRDAGEVLLRLVTQSAARVEMYGRLLGEAFEAAERLKAAHGAGLLVAAPEAVRDPLDPEDRDAMAEDPAVQTARADLERIFATGGVGALVGVKRDADRFGRIYETEEAIRGLARLEAEERDRCASFASKAVAAGLAERQVRLAESQGAAMYAVFARVLEGLGLSESQAGLVPGLLEREIRALTSGVVEGVVVGG